MKKLIIASAIFVLFSTSAAANSGLADRINEVRSYPDKTVETKKTMTCMEHEKTRNNISHTKQEYSELGSKNISLSHS